MIDTTGLPFQKPIASEKRLTLTPRQRRERLDAFCDAQGIKCCTCGKPMTRQQGLMNTATLGHKNPQPAGCSKDDSMENLLGAQCFKCNAVRGSQRG